MNFFERLIYFVLGCAMWTASAAFLAYPLKVLWNHSLPVAAGLPRITCAQSWCTLLLIGYGIALLELSPTPGGRRESP